MSTETAMIVSSAIAVVAALLTLLLTKIFGVRAAKKKEQERFFYEIYGRRLALYRKILKQAHLFFNKTFSFSASGTFDSSMDIAVITTSFIELSDRGAMVASPAVFGTLKLISDFIHNEVIIGKTLNTNENVKSFISFMTEHLESLRSHIRAETCPALVDEYLFELTSAKFSHKNSFPF